jgi:bifunctional DNase/RNase
MTGTTDQIQIDVIRIIISEIHDQQVVIYKETAGERTVSIMLGIFEATSIQRMLEGVPSPRPLTHDAWFSTICNMGGEVVESAITRLESHTYFAEIRVEINGGIVRIDVRPSDAVAIAIKAGAPLFMDRQVFEEVAS